MNSEIAKYFGIVRSTSQNYLVAMNERGRVLGQYARNCKSSGNHCLAGVNWLIFTGSTMSCSPMVAWRMYLSAGMFQQPYHNAHAR